MTILVWFDLLGSKRDFQGDAFSGEHSSPSINCLTGQDSGLVCQNGEYLCLVGTRLRVKECNENGRQHLLQVGGLCRKNNSFCVPGSFEEVGYVGDDATCLRDQNLCHEGYILCKEDRAGSKLN